MVRKSKVKKGKEERRNEREEEGKRDKFEKRAHFLSRTFQNKFFFHMFSHHR